MTDAEKVKTYMDQLDHPLKAEINAVRAILSGTDKKIAERIKWNAPSYYYKEDLVTFNPRQLEFVQLVFHHKEIVKIKSALLEGDYKDRRLASLRTMNEVKENKKELERIMADLVKRMDKK